MYLLIPSFSYVGNKRLVRFVRGENTANFLYDFPALSLYMDYEWFFWVIFCVPIFEENPRYCYSLVIVVVQKL